MMPSTSDNNLILETRDLTLSIAGTAICKQLNMQIPHGECVGILGQNGTGKTTLLHTLMQFRSAEQGEILLEGKHLNTWSRKALSSRLGILFQSTQDIMPSTVLETALIGRHPHLADWQWEDAQDEQIARDSLAAMGIAGLAQREVNTLSGGERQRLAIATLLTQQPRLFLLDEPGNHLDIAYQVQSLSLLRAHVLEQNAGLCMATHDINLAARFCDQILLLFGDGEFVLGTCAQVLTEENLSRAYGCGIRRIELEGRAVFFPA